MTNEIQVIVKYRNGSTVGRKMESETFNAIDLFRRTEAIVEVSWETPNSGWNTLQRNQINPEYL